MKSTIAGALDSDSSADEDFDLSSFSAACDPSLAGVYQTSGAILTDDRSVAVDCVTGDTELDLVLRDVKRACSAVRGGRSHVVTHAASIRPGATSASLSGHSYVLSLAAEILSSRVTIRSSDGPEKTTSSEVRINATSDDDLKLLPDVTVTRQASEDGELPRVSDAWLRKLQRRYGFSYFHPDEEEVISERCQQVALDEQLLATGALASRYAEHRNVNPKKLIRLEVNCDEGIIKKKRPKKSITATEDGKIIPPALAKCSHDKAQIVEKKLKAVKNCTQDSQQCHMIKASNIEDGVPSLSKKTKNRKRGPKKVKKSKVIEK
ncbi:uncharacterized protein LOC108671058 isoform X2 [Hyalella azteca]|uniref:Uncharacterized protein LOC108671058 isoform X2 n=1 Tax=Hyalella azteca TaxID=294128 RepID=A0A8B7NK50_HYAAZ|nr:uncharacterized protein LOC108671058 isoform X2 [Hyalella azteca]